MTPIPIDEDWPKAGAAGLLPNVDVPNAGAGDAAATGLLPNELEPNAGVADAPVAVDQGEDLAPSVDAPPNADGDPNAGALVAGEPNAVEPEMAGAVVTSAEATASAAPIPGYVVPPRIDSL